jgi:hypothetical protein
MGHAGIALDDIAEIGDFSNPTLLEVADRLERSITFQAFIAREIELDEVFRRVETGIKALADDPERRGDLASADSGVIALRRVLIKGAGDLEGAHSPYAACPGEVYTHGIASNTRAIDVFFDFCHEQGVTNTRLRNEQVFARGTLDT